ncbi:DUF2339 domain-containing protein [bacterium AH-315-E10]|nr:DUF2339 domain-containing protein [bacterium AH-315-E10]
MSMIIILPFIAILVVGVVIFFLLLQQQSAIRDHSINLTRLESRMLNRFDILSRTMDKKMQSSEDSSQAKFTGPIFADPPLKKQTPSVRAAEVVPELAPVLPPDLPKRPKPVETIRPVELEYDNTKSKVQNIIRAIAPEKPVQSDTDEKEIEIEPVTDESPPVYQYEKKLESDPLSDESSSVYRFEKKAVDILKSIWEWLVVGDKYRSESTSVEFAVASNWLLRIGSAILILGIGFFLKYSIDNDYISESVRVIMAVTTGVALIAAGFRFRKGDYALLAHGFIGIGICTLYFSVFAAFNFYHLITAPLAYGLMMLVTITAGVICARIQSMVIAIIGIIGGYTTPFILEGHSGNLTALFVYTLILTLGVLYITVKRNWHLLNYLSFISVQIIILHNIYSNYNTGLFWNTAVFLTLFYLLFTAVIYVYNIIQRKKSSLLELLMTIINVGLYFSTLYYLVEKDFNYRWMGLVAIAIALTYAGQLYIAISRKFIDKELILSFIGLAVTFLTLSIPISISKDWLNIFWAIEALMLLWLAIRVNSNFLKGMSYLLYTFVIFYMVAVDMSDQYFMDAMSSNTLAEYGRFLLSRIMILGIPLGSLFLGNLMHSRITSGSGLLVEEETDSDISFDYRLMSQVVTVLIPLAIFICFNFEVNQFFSLFYDSFRLPMLTVLWCLFAAFIITLSSKYSQTVMLNLFMFLAVIIFIKIITIDFYSWKFSLELIFGQHLLMDFIIRSFDVLVYILGLLFAVTYIKRFSIDTKSQVQFIYSLAFALLFIISTLEVNTFFTIFEDSFTAGAISILWTCFSLSFLIWGILKNHANVRYIALTLMVVTVIKVFLFDLSNLTEIFRIISFIILGILVLFGSFLYLKYKDLFISEKEVG